jgi:phospholipase C
MKNSRRKNHGLNRRQFIRSSALLAGTALLSPWAISNLRAAAAPAALSPANAPRWTR